MKKIIAILLIMCCSLPAIAKKRQNEEIITPLTQLEKRQFQTKTYQAQDSILAMKALLNVLQDEGFIVYNVNSLLGYIYGVKDFDISDPNVDISKEFGVTKSRLNYNGVKVATLEVSANVTQYGDKSRVRVNFKRKLLNEYGNAQMIDDIDDAQYYDEFYAKVDSAIALQKQFLQKLQKETPVNLKKTTPKPKPVIKHPKPIKPIQETESTDIENNEHSINTIQECDKNEIIERENVDSATEAPPSKEIKEPKPQDNKLESEVQTNPEEIEKANSKELKEALKQAKEETKQAQKELHQAQKEALEAQKRIEKEAKQAQKEALDAQKNAQKEAKHKVKETE